FIRQFMRGATMLTLDAAGRVLLPEVLLDYAKIAGEVVLACQFDRIEVWPKAAYEEVMNGDVREDGAALAEEVMGTRDVGGGGDEQGSVPCSRDAARRYRGFGDQARWGVCGCGVWWRGAFERDLKAFGPQGTVDRF